MKITIKQVGVTVACASFGALVLASCGSKRSSGDLTAILQIASLQSKATLNTFRTLSTGLASVPGSASHYSFAKIDGIKVTVTKVQGRDPLSDNPKSEAVIGEEIELSDDATKAISLSKSVAWNSGDHAGIDLYLQNSWKVKGYCKTAVVDANNFTLVYTRAAGAATVACTTGSPCTDLPSDYDYTSYSFLDPYYSEHTGDVTIASHYKFSLAAASSPKLSLFYDGSYNTACWDGAGAWDDNAAVGGMTNAGSSSAGRAHYYPDATPAFGISTLPIFAYVTADQSEVAPTVATFLTSSDHTDLDGASRTAFDYSKVEVASLVYKSDGTLVIGNARNIHGFNASGFFDMDLTGFESGTTTGQNFYASGWYYKGGSEAPTFVKNRRFTDFVAPTGDTVTGIAVTDGDGCGQTLKDFQGGNPSRGCFKDNGAASRTLYFRAATR